MANKPLPRFDKYQTPVAFMAFKHGDQEIIVRTCKS